MTVLRARVLLTVLLVASPAWAAKESVGWVARAPMPTARTEVGVAAIGTTVYVVGGFGPDGAVATVEAYDTALDRWRTVTPLPVPVHHPGVAGLGGRLYVVGGFGPGWTATDAVWRYDPATDRWQGIARLPTARGALGVTTLNGLLYAVGGRADHDTGALEVYDPAMDRWVVKAPMPTQRNHLAVVAARGKLYAIGGRLGDFLNNVSTNEEYTTATNQWQGRASLPTARSGIAGTAWHDRIYILGGEAITGTFHEHEEYDPAADAWQTRAPLPTARHGLGAVVIGNALYVLGGGPRPGGTGSQANEVFDLTTVLAASANVPGRIRVVATLPFLKEFVERVGGDQVEVISLLTGQESEHVYQPRPRDILAVHHARLLVQVGVGLEVWVDGLIRNAEAPNLTIITTARGIPMIRDAEAEPSHPAGGREGNPHVWLDPENAKMMLKQITDALIQVDRRHQAAYLTRQAAFLKEIDELERDYRSRFLKIANRRVITYHPAWPYFARRFGIQIRGTILAQVGTEPSAKALEALIIRIRREQIRVIVSEPQLNPRLPQILADETGAKVVTLTPLPGGVPGTETYVAMMTYNLNQLLTALSQ